MSDNFGERGDHPQSIDPTLQQRCLGRISFCLTGWIAETEIQQDIAREIHLAFPSIPPGFACGATWPS